MADGIVASTDALLGSDVVGPLPSPVNERALHPWIKVCNLVVTITLPWFQALNTYI